MGTLTPSSSSSSTTTRAGQQQHYRSVSSNMSRRPSQLEPAEGRQQHQQHQRWRRQAMIDLDNEIWIDGPKATTTTTSRPSYETTPLMFCGARYTSSSSRETMARGYAGFSSTAESSNFSRGKRPRIIIHRHNNITTRVI